jgi:hypothetical protein
MVGYAIEIRKGEEIYLTFCWVEAANPEMDVPKPQSATLCKGDRLRG